MTAAAGPFCRAFIYARCSSSRLPGKVLMNLDGRTSLEIILEKVATLGIGSVIVTSKEPSDDRLADWCQERGVPVYRGSLPDVSERTVGAIEAYPCDAFFRINGDSPFLQTDLLQRGVDLLTDGAALPDLVTNLVTRTYPYGIAVELINAQTFVRAVPYFDGPEKEHITSYFYQRLDRFTIVNIVGEEDFSQRRLVLDTPADLKFIQQLLRSQPNLFSLGTAELYRLTQHQT